MTDIVIPLGTGSRWDDNELRYALRGIEKHLQNIGRVIIVGRVPNWIKNVTFIEETVNYYKDRNIMERLLTASKVEGITPDFLYFNDDHFLLQDLDAETFSNYADGTLFESYHKRPRDTYAGIISKTYNTLKQQGLPYFNFDIHCPIIINKTLFRSVMAHYDWTNQFGYLVKSLYANNIMLKPEIISDCKIDSPRTEAAIELALKGRPFFSIGDRGLNAAMKQKLEILYPEKSKYE